MGNRRATVVDDNGKRHHFSVLLLDHLPQCGYNFRPIESGPVLGEYTLFAQVEEQFATVHILHHKAQTVIRLK